MRELFRLIDWMMALPKTLETGFIEEVTRYDEENKMRYVTSEAIARLKSEAGEQNT